ncbi:MAG TPA: FkbM family methyltransferase [Bacteroidales bacterium]|nr:FkbM family methyltransferase [Bacteroidales bacterium]
MKKIIKKLLDKFGYEIKKTDVIREAGDIEKLLQNLKNRGLNCKSIMDVGANRTHWSRMAKRVYPLSRFYLIEPLKEMQEKLEAFCQEYKDSSYFLVGAGAKNEKMVFTIWDDLDGSSFLPPPDKKLKIIGKQRDVEIVTIDSLIETSKVDTPDLIKLDVQGFELEALKGASKTFGITEVYVLEVSLFTFGDLPNFPIFSDVINFMLERDYVVYDFPGFRRRPFDMALGQCDVCFVKRNGTLRSSNRWE